MIFSCKKDKVKKATFSGVVINMTTKEPVSGLAVVFTSIKDTRRGIPFGKTLTGKYKDSKIITTTNMNGEFTFNDVER